MGRVDDLGSLRHLQGRHVPGRVDPVPGGELGFGFGRADSHLCGTPGRPGRGIGGEVDLHRTVGEHHRTDVPSLDHRVAAVLGHPSSLEIDHDPANLGNRSYPADDPCDVTFPDLPSHVFAVEEHPTVDLPVLVPAHLGGHRRRIVGVDSGPQHGEGSRPVVGAGVEMGPAEQFGDPASHRRLARTARTVDRHDEAHSFSSMSKNPGQVLATQSGSEISIPSTTRPARANDMAIRWSS